MPKSEETRLFNLPNTMTIAGLASTAVWLGGGSGWWALAGLVLDELDGRVARATGETTETGSQLDWAGDVAMSTAVLAKLGAPYVYAASAVVAGQVALRSSDYRPTVGSARALLTLYALYKDGFFKRGGK